MKGKERKAWPWRTWGRRSKLGLGQIVTMQPQLSPGYRFAKEPQLEDSQPFAASTGAEPPARSRKYQSPIFGLRSFWGQFWRNAGVFCLSREGGLAPSEARQIRAERGGPFRRPGAGAQQERNGGQLPRSSSAKLRGPCRFHRPAFRLFLAGVGVGSFPVRAHFSIAAQCVRESSGWTAAAALKIHTCPRWAW